MKKHVVLGIDIGGTNTDFGFIDKDGNCIVELSVPTRANESAETLFMRIFNEADKAYTNIQERYEFVGIGIGAPNANYYRGTVELPPNLNWGVVNVREIVKEYHGLPIAITNDANAAAIGEMLFGSAKAMKDFIVITLGTGLGSGIVVNGELVYGHDGFAGELGHVIIDPNGRECGCGRKGCLETYASASGIRRTIFELLCNVGTGSILRDVSFNDITSRAIYEAALQGDTIALKAFEITGEILGKSLANFVTYTSPEAIVLFGGLALAGDLIVNPVKKSMEDNMLNIFKRKVKILLSGLTGTNAAVLGSAALIWNEINKKRSG